MKGKTFLISFARLIFLCYLRGMKKKKKTTMIKHNMHFSTKRDSF